MKNPLLILFLGGVVLTLGDLVMKKWVGNNQTLWYLAGLGIYLIGLMFLAQSFRLQNIAVASLLLVIFNIITLTLVSWLFLRKIYQYFRF